jgi:hypothetical protein
MDFVSPFVATTAPEEEKQARVWKAVPMPKNLNKKWFGSW